MYNTINNNFITQIKVIFVIVIRNNSYYANSKRTQFTYK